jgi:hypothetical protein
VRLPDAISPSASATSRRAVFVRQIEPFRKPRAIPRYARYARGVGGNDNAYFKTSI